MVYVVHTGRCRAEVVLTELEPLPLSNTPLPFELCLITAPKYISQKV